MVRFLNVLTGTKSSQACPIYGSTPKKTFNFTSPVFDPKPNTLQYGISPLHAWIRLFECILHISYRIHIKTWQVRDATENELFKQRKLQIQDRFWKQMGLHVDKTKIMNLEILMMVIFLVVPLVNQNYLVK